MLRGYLFTFMLAAICLKAYCQENKGDTLIFKGGDTVVAKGVETIDTAGKKPADTSIVAQRKALIRKTIIRSAILPGWGQVTNKQAWKIPFVYAAIGTPAYLFFNNLKEYKDLRLAYKYKVDTIPSNDALIPLRFSTLSSNSLRFYRDDYRRNIDYSVLVFILAWGLNVADAAVFAHLKDFDVTDDLSLKFKPVLQMKQFGFGMVVYHHNPGKFLKTLP